MIKWIGAFIGSWAYGFRGAIAGYFVGYLIEQLFPKAKNKTQWQSTSNNRSRKQPTITPRDFELNLLSLASLIIKADGSINQAELDYVRKYFVQSYGKERANATFKTFNDVIKKREINTGRIATYVAQHTRYESRLQILHFLFGIANADGFISENEVYKINEIARFFRVTHQDFESIKAMFIKKADNAYKILEIEKTVTDSEVKKAYRSMVKKYHPDKLINLPDHLKKGAEEKFRAVQEAYEQIQKERGI